MRLRFGDCVFDPDTRQLVRAGQPVPVPPKVFELLDALIRERPRAVSKTDLHQRLWPDTSRLGRQSDQPRCRSSRRARRRRQASARHPHGPALRLRVRGRGGIRAGESAGHRFRLRVSARLGQSRGDAPGGLQHPRSRPGRRFVDRRLQRLAPACPHHRDRRGRDAGGSGQQERNVSRRAAGAGRDGSQRRRRDPHWNGDDDPEAFRSGLDEDGRNPLNGGNSPAGRRECASMTNSFS